MSISEFDNALKFALNIAVSNPIFLAPLVLIIIRFLLEPFTGKNGASAAATFEIMGIIPAGIYILIVGNAIKGHWEFSGPASIFSWLPVLWVVFTYLMTWAVKAQVEREEKQAESKPQD